MAALLVFFLVLKPMWFESDNAQKSVTDSKESKEESEAASTGEPVEISYMHLLPDAPEVDRLVEQWNEENPDIQVYAEQFQGSYLDYMPQLKQNVADGKAACLAQVSYAELPGAFTDKLVQDVTDYVTDDVKSTYEGTIDLMSVGGKYYGIPQDNGPLVYFYNAKAFEDLGIEVPITALKNQQRKRCQAVR